MSEIEYIEALENHLLHYTDEKNRCFHTNWIIKNREYFGVKK